MVNRRLSKHSVWEWNSRSNDFPYGLYDAHCHFFELNKKDIFQEEIKSAREAGVTGFFCSALEKEQFDWYEENSDLCYWYAGIHPYFEESKKEDLDKIIRLIKFEKIIGIGEIGLDKRNKNTEWQTQILNLQLEIARDYDLPVIFHIVGKYYDLYKILKKSFPKIRGILHGFNGNVEIFEMFKKFNLAFSIGNKFNNTSLAKEILKYGFYTFETDAPYQKPNSEADDINHLKNIYKVIDFLSQFMNKDLLIKYQYKTLKAIFNL